MDTSYLTSQVATIIGQLHGLFDEIGVPSHERDSRESELFTALSESLHNHLRLVTSEKIEMTDEANRIIKTIKQMEASLDDDRGNRDFEPEDAALKVTYPLTDCLRGLKEKYSTINKIHKERYEEVRKLAQALESYSNHLETSFVQIKLPPINANSSSSPTFDLSPSYVAKLDHEFTRVYEEYTRRIATVAAISEDVIKLWSELGTPQAQTDAMIVKYYRDAPEQLGLHEDDLARLRGRRDKLVEEKRGREKRLKDLRTAVEGLWDRLGVTEAERKIFLSNNRGCGMRIINDFEDELARLNELKRQNLGLFVEDARCKLQELWDGLYFSEEEMLEFTPAFSDVYSDALLSSHEAEIARLESLKEQRAPMLELIDRHRSLVKDRDDLAASSQDASRLMARGQKGERRDPTRLLREEKMRKRIAKDLPKVEQEIRKALEKWENEYGRPFCVRGERYLDELAAAAARAPPPRSKTPSGPAPPAKAGRTAPSVSRAASSFREAPPSRAGAKTPADSVRRNPLASSVSTAGGRTPSKIPARVPLGNMPHGKNSPERRAAADARNTANTTRKMGPPSMAPPPRMRDLHVPAPAPTPVNGYGADPHRQTSVDSSSGSVRHVSPEDVYDERRQYSSYSNGSHLASHQATPQSYHDLQSSTPLGDPYARPGQPGHGPRPLPMTNDSRQISGTSTSENTVSGSENWETYDDQSEPERDVSDAYYARLRAARGKRVTPDDGYAAPHGGPGKKMRGLPGAGGGRAGMAVMEGAGGQLVKVSGSEAGWTDEDIF
ncbi:MAG: hypothetical protein M1817_005610 [Caeruleum heppii]|nr:MAG: hypothetical protein M1817_005610 [Caeruleum heppii]